MSITDEFQHIIDGGPVIVLFHIVPRYASSSIQKTPLTCELLTVFIMYPRESIKILAIEGPSKESLEILGFSKDIFS